MEKVIIFDTNKKETAVAPILKNTMIDNVDINNAEEININLNRKNNEVTLRATFNEDGCKKVVEKTGFLNSTLKISKIIEFEDKQPKDSTEEVLNLFENCGYTQDEIASTLGISQTSVSRILNNNGYYRGKKR